MPRDVFDDCVSGTLGFCSSHSHEHDGTVWRYGASLRYTQLGNIYWPMVCNSEYPCELKTLNSAKPSAKPRADIWSKGCPPAPQLPPFSRIRSSVVPDAYEPISLSSCSVVLHPWMLPVGCFYPPPGQPPCATLY